MTLKHNFYFDVILFNGMIVISCLALPSSNLLAVISYMLLVNDICHITQVFLVRWHHKSCALQSSIDIWSISVCAYNSESMFCKEGTITCGKVGAA